MVLLQRGAFLLTLLALFFAPNFFEVQAQAPLSVAMVGIVAGPGPYPSGTPPHNSTIQSAASTANYLGWTSYNQDGTTRYTYGADKPCTGSASPSDVNFSGSYVATGNVWVSPSATTRYTIACGDASDTVTITIPGTSAPEAPKEDKGGGFLGDLFKKFKSFFGGNDTDEVPEESSESPQTPPFTPTPQSPTGGGDVIPPTTPSGLSVDMKVNGSDGPALLLNRGDRFIVTWTSAQAKRCTFAIMDPSGNYLTNGGVSVQSGIDVDYTHPFYPKEGEYLLTTTCFDALESNAASVKEEIRVSLNPQSKPYIVMKVPRSTRGAVGLSYIFDWESAGGIKEVSLSLESVPDSQSGVLRTIRLGTVPDQGFFSWFVPTSVPSGNYRVVGKAIGVNGMENVGKSEPFSLENPNYQAPGPDTPPLDETITYGPGDPPAPPVPDQEEKGFFKRITDGVKSFLGIGSDTSEPTPLPSQALTTLPPAPYSLAEADELTRLEVSQVAEMLRKFSDSCAFEAFPGSNDSLTSRVLYYLWQDGVVTDDLESVWRFTYWRKVGRSTRLDAGIESWWDKAKADLEADLKASGKEQMDPSVNYGWLITAQTIREGKKDCWLKSFPQGWSGFVGPNGLTREEGYQLAVGQALGTIVKFGDQLGNNTPPPPFRLSTSSSTPTPIPTTTGTTGSAPIPPSPAPTSAGTSDAPPSEECIVVSRNLFLDVDAPSETAKLQRALIKRGYLRQSAPTGVFETQTNGAVSDFQGDHGIVPSGFVGELTRAQIKLATCGEGSASDSASTPTVSAALPTPPVPNPAPLPVSKACSSLTVDGKVALGEVEPAVIFIVPSGWTRDGQTIRTKEGATVPVWPNVPTQVSRMSGGTAQDPQPGQYLFSDNTIRLADGSILRDLKAEGQPPLNLSGGKTSEDVMRNADGTALRMGREHVLREAGIPAQMAAAFYSRKYSPFSFEGFCAEIGTRYDVSGGASTINPPTTPAFTPTEEGQLGNPPTLTVATSPRCGGYYDISWTSVPGAIGYRLYRNTPTNTEPPIYEGSGLSYTDGMVIAGTVQQYRIEAYNATSRTAKSGLSYVPNASQLCQGTPKPTITFTATPSTISSGMSSVISWNAQNAKFCRASLGTEDWSGVFGSYEYLNNMIPPQGSKTAGPITIPPTLLGTMYQSFYLSCFGEGGSNSANLWMIVSPLRSSLQGNMFANLLEGLKGTITP